MEHRRGTGFFCWCHGPNVVYDFYDPRTKNCPFQKVRRAVDEGAHGRTKDLRYRHRKTETSVWVWQKPPVADELLYGLDQTLAGNLVYLVEGEKDADSLRARGVIAVSHHQGAENPMNANQAMWLQSAWKVVIVADRDDAGAWCAAKHYNLLVALRHPPAVYVVRARVGKDATDHLEAGFGVTEFPEVKWKKFVRKAQEYEKFKAKNPKPSGSYAYRPRVIGRA